MDKIFVNAMTPTFEGSEDVHVRKYVAYGKTADHKLYLEPAYTTQVNQADMQDAFNKGALLIMVGTTAYEPLAMNGNIVMTAAKTGEPSEAFAATETYSVGDLVIYEGKAYKCKTAIQTAGAWDATKWDEVVTLSFVEWASKAPAAT